MKDVKRTMNNILPAGTILLYSGDRIPDGWLLCDGAALETGDSRYADLLTAIGKQWNRRTDKGDVFRVPELGYMPLPQARAAWATGVAGSALEDHVSGSIIYIIKT